MRMMIIGFVMMFTGVSILFAMVIGVTETGLLSSIGAYSLVIVGLLLSGIGVASAVNTRRNRS